MNTSETQTSLAPNLMLPIKIETSRDHISSFNEIWNYMDLVRLNFRDALAAMPSVIARVRKKMIDKESTLTLTIHTKKAKSFKLEPFEAKFLEIYIYEIIAHMPLGHARAIASSVANKINQHFA